MIKHFKDASAYNGIPSPFSWLKNNANSYRHIIVMGLTWAAFQNFHFWVTKTFMAKQRTRLVHGFFVFHICFWKSIIFLFYLQIFEPKWNVLHHARLIRHKVFYMPHLRTCIRKGLSKFCTPCQLNVLDLIVKLQISLGILLICFLCRTENSVRTTKIGDLCSSPKILRNAWWVCVWCGVQQMILNLKKLWPMVAVHRPGCNLF